MARYIIKRLIGLIPVIIGVSICAFLLIHLVPGDPARAILGERATEQALNNLREQMGLNDPLYIQYGRFMGNVLQGDLGRSVITHTPVVEEFAHRFPATLELSIVAMIIAVIVGVFAGVISAVKQYSLFDNVSMVAALLGVSLPIFWLGLMMQWLFAFKLGILDASARLSVGIQLDNLTNFYILDSIITGNWTALGDAIKHIIMPSIALATIPMAVIARMTRSSMLEVLKQDYIRTARAKGLKENLVIFKHALKNAFLPVLTVMGLQFGTLMGGAVLTETIFSWPGVGRLMYEAIMQRDFPIVQNGILIISVIFVFINLIVDVLYSYVDPRIRID